jgi:hypothetical protein
MPSRGHQLATLSEIPPPNGSHTFVLQLNIFSSPVVSCLKKRGTPSSKKSCPSSSWDASRPHRHLPSPSDLARGAADGLGGRRHPRSLPTLRTGSAPATAGPAVDTGRTPLRHRAAPVSAVAAPTTHPLLPPRGLLHAARVALLCLDPSAPCFALSLSPPSLFHAANLLCAVALLCDLEAI